MHDIKWIRTEPARFDKGWKDRGLDAQTSVILALDEDSRRIQTQLQALQNKRNESSKLIGQRKAKGENADDLMAEVAAIKDQMEDLENQGRQAAEKLQSMLESLPNIMQDDVPIGRDETENVEIHRIGTPVTRNDNPDHQQIGEDLGMMSADLAAKMSGARFTFLHSGLARLERALAQFMLDTHTNEHGLTEVSPPLLVRDTAVYGVGQLPKFEEDLFKVNTGHYLISTAEVPLTNLVSDMILDEGALPLRLTAMTPCFRSEAGSAGKDTRGMIRQHQFYKVEMVTICTPDQSRDEHERMAQCAETILKKLELPFRRIVLCTGDAGFCSQKTYDLEVWIPAQGKYREISSVSNCGDFQARRMKARCRPKGTKETRYVHTLNGSGLAVGRTLVAVIENYYDPSDGSVVVPAVLRPYMGGVDRVKPLAGDMALLRTAEG